MTDELAPFQFAKSVVIQLVTLATGITTITVTFFNDVAPHASTASRALIVTSWGLFVLSVGCGCAALLALTGIVGDPKSTKDIFADNVTQSAKAQVLLFMTALVVTVVGGAFAFF